MKKTTENDVKRALKEKPDRVIADIQWLLTEVCKSDCIKCKFVYLCIGGETYKK